MLKGMRLKLLASVKELSARYPTAEARVNLLSLTMGLACVLAIGPFLQLYSLALLTSEEASIYSTAYSTDVIKQPQLGEWLMTLWWPQFLIMALIIGLSLRVENFRAAFIRVAGFAFIVLTAFDLFFLLIDGNLLSVEAFQCVVANLVGGPIAAALLLGMVALAEWLAVVLREHRVMRLTLLPMAPVICGLALLLLSYYLISLFYSPTKSKFSLRAVPPISAFYTESKTAVASIGETVPSKANMEPPEGDGFQVFGEQVRLPKRLLWDGKTEDLEVNWKNESGSKYDLYVRVFDGCSSGFDRKMLGDPSALKFEGVGQIAISGVDGLANLRIGLVSESGYFKMAQDPVGMFWILEDIEDKDDKSLRILRFVGSDAQLMYWNPTGGLDLAFANLLIDHDAQGRGYPAKRSITLFVDGKRLQFNFDPDQSAQWSDKIGCRLVKLPRDSSDFSVKSALHAGLHISLIPRDKTIRTALSRRESDQFRIKGLNGWVVAQGIAPDEVGEFVTSGPVGVMGVRSGIETLDVNDEKIEVAHQDGVQVGDGEISSFIEDGNLVVEGRAASIHKNGGRINRTRWERLDWPARAVLFGGVPALFAWFFSMLIMALKSNRSIGGGILIGRT